MPNTEFEVVEVVITAATLKFKSGTEYGVLNYSFQLRRSSMAYLIGSVLPLIAISVLLACSEVNVYVYASARPLTLLTQVRWKG